jgi:ATP-binding cassette subfamily B protein
VKGFGQEQRELGKLEAQARRLFASKLRAIRLQARYSPTLQAVPLLGQVGILVLGGWLALQGNITLGTFLAFSSYLGQLVAPVRMLSNFLVTGQQARASVIRVFEVIDSEPVVTEKPDALDLPPGSGAVELRDVTFGYLESDPVLHGLSLRVEPGETVALVGTAGSGKSTISQLLPRFYDVQRGTVLVDGHDVRDLTLTSLRSRIGVVFEDSFLFSDSVRVNIAYGRPDATDEQVRAAARAAEAMEFIEELPEGLDTVVGERGLTLSGGQRQRIALARALLSDPMLLLLDDATSAVDPQTEAEIHATLRQVMAGRTTILIAHRQSTLQLANRIAVLDNGRVLDVGTHDELMERCPLYRLLLSGPGDDAEGIEAGELDAFLAQDSVVAQAAVDARNVARGAVGAASGGTTTGNGNGDGNGRSWRWRRGRLAVQHAADTCAAGAGGQAQAGDRCTRRQRRRRAAAGSGVHAAADTAPLLGGAAARPALRRARRPRLALPAALDPSRRRCRCAAAHLRGGPGRLGSCARRRSHQLDQQGGTDPGGRAYR